MDAHTSRETERTRNEPETTNVAEKWVKKLLAPQKTERKPVILQGLHLNLHCPTEELLTIICKGLDPETFRAIGYEVEDWRKDVDEAYKKKTIRGSGWKGRGTKVGIQRIRIIKISPFPSRFSNILRELRRDLYADLHKSCLVLEESGDSHFKRNIYILPYSNAVALMTDIKRANFVIDDLNVKIQEFLGTSYYDHLKMILKQHRIIILEKNIRWHIDHVDFEVTNLALNPAAIKETVSKEYQRMFQRIDAKKAAAEAELGMMIDQRKVEAEANLQKQYDEGMQLLYTKLQEKEKDLVVKAVENMRKKLKVTIGKIVGAHKLKPETVKEELEKLRRIAESVGLEAIAQDIIIPLTIVVDNPEKAFDLLGSTDIETAVNDRITSMVDKL